MSISYPAGLRAAACALLSAALLGACGGGGGATPAPPAPPTQAAATELTLTSSGASTIAGGATVTLNAGLNGAGSVNWALAAGSPGALSATSGASVSYTPPASFTGVTAVTISATSGNLSKNIVLQLAPSAPGLSLLAGTVTPGNANIDGRGTAARFSAIRALATDGSGAIYTSDTTQAGRAVIRKISADGSVSTLNADLSALPVTASINAITPLADGSLYFSDVQQSHLSSGVYKATTSFRKLDASGKLSTLGVIDDGSIVSWQLIAAPDGTLYVRDSTAIYLLGADGSRRLLAGASAALTTADVDGTGAAARFYGIRQFRVTPNGNLYVLDYFGLRQVSPAGVVTTLLTQAVDSTAAFDLSLDQQGNPLLLSTAKAGKTNTIGKFSNGALSTLYAVGATDGADGQYLNLLLGTADGAVITTDGVSLRRTGTDGKTVVLAGVRSDTYDSTADGQGAQARLVNPGLLATDRDGNIYAVENAGAVNTPIMIRKITPAGAVSTYATSDLPGYISGMVMTPANILVVSLRSGSDFGGSLYQVGQGGGFTLIAGGGFYGAPLQQLDGPGSAAVFGRPTLAGVDKDGNLYVTDQSQTHRDTYTIRKVTPLGAVTTIAGLPAGLNAAADGNVYQVNAAGTGAPGNAVIRVAPDGTRTVLAGVESGSSFTNLPGPLPGLLYQVRGVTPLGGKVFAVAAGHGIYTLVLP